jgi:hypothetical protein
MITRTFIKHSTPLQIEKDNCVLLYGKRSLFTLLCWLTSQLLVYCVHISLSTCYDWPTNTLLLLTVSAVCINLSAVSYCQRSSVSCEKNVSSSGSTELAVCSRQVLYVLFLSLGVRPVWPLPEILCSSWFYSIFTNMPKPAMTDLFRIINVFKYKII